MDNTTLISRIIDLFSDKKSSKPVCDDALKEQPLEETPVQSPVKPNVWGISGRSAMMQTRTMMQLKGFHK